MKNKDIEEKVRGIMSATCLDSTEKGDEILSLIEYLRKYYKKKYKSSNKSLLQDSSNIVEPIFSKNNDSCKIPRKIVESMEDKLAKGLEDMVLKMLEDEVLPKVGEVWRWKLNISAFESAKYVVVQNITDTGSIVYKGVNYVGSGVTSQESFLKCFDRLDNILKAQNVIK